MKSARTRRARRSCGRATWTRPGPGSSPTNSSSSPSVRRRSSPEPANAASACARRPSSSRVWRAIAATRASSRSAPVKTGASRANGAEKSRARLAREPSAERCSAALRLAADLVDRLEREGRMALLPQLARGLRRPGARLARLLFEVVGQPRVAQEARGSQPGQQVVGRGVVLGAPGERDQPAAERRVAERHPPRQRVRDPVGRQDLLGQRRGVLRLAPHDRDVLGRVALVADQPCDVRGDLLDLGSLTAGLQHHDRALGIRAGGRARIHLEQVALEVMQRGMLVVVSPAVERDDLVGERQQVVVRLGARGKRDAAGLEGQRQRHRRMAGERLDGVDLQRRQVVEAVEEHGRGAPAMRIEPDRVEGGRGVQFFVAAAEALQRLAVGEDQRRQLARERAPRLAVLSPHLQRLRQPRRIHALLFELGHEPHERLRRSRGSSRRVRAA